MWGSNNSLTGFAKLLSAIPWNIPLLTCIFLAPVVQRQDNATQKWQVRYSNSAMVYHEKSGTVDAIENTVAN